MGANTAKRAAATAKEASEQDSAFAEQEVPEDAVGGSPREERRRPPLRWARSYDSELPLGGSFTSEFLSQWDGVRLPMCISVCGKVFDVSSSENFEPDHGYGKLWAGKDATYALALCSLKPEDVDRYDYQIDSLSEQQVQALAAWYKHFCSKYPVVGKLEECAARGLDFGVVEEASKVVDSLKPPSKNKTVKKSRAPALEKTAPHFGEEYRKALEELFDATGFTEQMLVEQDKETVQSLLAASEMAPKAQVILLASWQARREAICSKEDETTADEDELRSSSSSSGNENLLGNDKLLGA